MNLKIDNARSGVSLPCALLLLCRFVFHASMIDGLLWCLFSRPVALPSSLMPKSPSHFLLTFVASAPQPSIFFTSITRRHIAALQSKEAAAHRHTSLPIPIHFALTFYFHNSNSIAPHQRFIMDRQRMVDAARGSSNMLGSLLVANEDQDSSFFFPPRKEEKSPPSKSLELSEHHHHAGSGFYACDLDGLAEMIESQEARDAERSAAMAKRRSRSSRRAAVKFENNSSREEDSCSDVDAANGEAERGAVDTSLCSSDGGGGGGGAASGGKWRSVRNAPSLSDDSFEAAARRQQLAVDAAAMRRFIAPDDDCEETTRRRDVLRSSARRMPPNKKKLREVPSNNGDGPMPEDGGGGGGRLGTPFREPPTVLLRRRRPISQPPNAYANACGALTTTSSSSWETQHPSGDDGDNAGSPIFANSTNGEGPVRGTCSGSGRLSLSFLGEEANVVVSVPVERGLTFFGGDRHYEDAAEWTSAGQGQGDDDGAWIDVSGVADGSDGSASDDDEEEADLFAPSGTSAGGIRGGGAPARKAKEAELRIVDTCNATALTQHRMRSALILPTPPHSSAASKDAANADPSAGQGGPPPFGVSPFQQAFSIFAIPTVVSTKQLSAADLRAELRARGLSVAGDRAALARRLDAYVSAKEAELLVANGGDGVAETRESPFTSSSISHTSSSAGDVAVDDRPSKAAKRSREADTDLPSSSAQGRRPPAPPVRISSEAKALIGDLRANARAVESVLSASNGSGGGGGRSRSAGSSVSVSRGRHKRVLSAADAVDSFLASL